MAIAAPNSVTAYVREAIKRGGPALGRVVPITSLTGTTVVCASLNRGDAPTKFVGRWMVRRDATGAPADRVRSISAFDGATGTFTHAGAAYADTTATNEYLEIMEIDPVFVDESLNIVMAKFKRREEVIIPTGVVDRYWIGDQGWIVGPTDITKVTFLQNPVMSRNRYMEKWNEVYGATNPDWWTVTGAGATAARSATASRRGAYTAALTRAGTNATLSQDVGLLWGGTSQLSLQGKSVVGVLVVQSSLANQIRVQIDDGVTVSSSGYHTGGGTLEELSVKKTLAATATKCVVQASIEVDGATYIDELYSAYSPDIYDAIRNDSYGDGIQENFRVSQGGAPLSLFLGRPGFGNQYVVYSRRPYPAFTGTRITGGLADADTSDAPLIPIAVGLLAEVFTAMAKRDDDTAAQYGAMAAEYTREFTLLQKAHLQADTSANGGIPLKPGFAAVASRFGRR